MEKTGAIGPIAVVGATGQQGGAVATALLEQGRPVRAVVRNVTAPRARALRERGAEVVQADQGDADALRTAFTGASGVFSVQPSSGQAGSGIDDDEEVALGIRVADAAQHSGVGHLVYTSANAAGGVTGVGHFDTKSRIEEHVRGLDIVWSIVRPAAFMEILLLPGMGLDRGRITFFMHPDQAMQFVAVRDVGRVVAAMFASPDRHGGRTLELAGDSVSGRGLADSLSDAVGRPVRYERFSDEVLADPMMTRLADLVDKGPLAGRAPLEALYSEFGFLLDLVGWLRGPGAAPLARALEPHDGAVTLR